MSTRSPSYLDGYLGTPLRVHTSPRSYPFAANGDLTTAVYVVTFLVAPGAWAPTARGTVDPLNAGFYLIEETEPDAPRDAAAARFTRAYGNIPLTQIVRGSIKLSKPSLSGTFPQAKGDFRIFQPDETLEQFDAYVAREVLNAGASGGFGPSGGTYTISFLGNTTGALAYNAAASTVQTALNLLTPISDRGNVTISGTYNTGFAIAFNTYAQITIDDASLTGGPLTKAQQVTNSGYAQVVGSYKGAFWTDRWNEITLDISGVTYTGAETYGLVPTCFANDPGDNTRQTAGIAYYIEANPGRITGGTFRIVLPEGTTAPISVDATFAEVTTAMDAVVAGRYVASAVVAGQGSTLSFENGVGGRVLEFYIDWQRSAPTGGTFTLTAFSQTTAALAYNATASDVQTALNGLSQVANKGNCVVTGNLKDGFAIAFSNPAFTVDVTSLTPSGSTAAVSITDSDIGRLQSIIFAGTLAFRDVYSPNHGISNGGVIYIKDSTTYYGGISRYLVVDANTVRLTLLYGDAYVVASPITEIGPRTRAAYKPGSSTVRCRRITDYYLPGVTTGITTADDIPLPINQADATALLLAILAGAGAINVEVGDIFTYRESPILGLTRTEVDAIDI